MRTIPCLCGVLAIWAGLQPARAEPLPYRISAAECLLDLATKPDAGAWTPVDAAAGTRSWRSEAGYALAIDPRESGHPAVVVRLERSDGAPFRVTRYAHECSVPLGQVVAVFDTRVPPGPSIFHQAPQLQVAIDARPNAGVPFLMACDHHGRSSLAVGPLDQAGTYRLTGRVDRDRYRIRVERREYGAEWFSGNQMEDHIHVSTRPEFWFDAARSYADATDAFSGYVPRPVPEHALEPAYSTWYAFKDQIDEKLVWENAVVARDMGIRNFLISIGWSACEDWFSEQNAWGDYTACRSRFSDFAGLVRRLQGELGMHVQLWVAPMWVGAKSQAFERMKDYRSKWPGGGYDRNLDPRSPQAREHIRERLAFLAREHGVEGLYVDFLDTIFNRNDARHEKEPAHFGTAYAEFLGACYAGFASGADRPLVEVRQPFANLLAKHHASVFNTTYTDGDWERNRLLSVMLRPFSNGVLSRCDALTFTREQLQKRDEVGRILSAIILCGPPTLSMDLTKLDAGNRAQLTAWLGFYREHRENLARGTFRPFGSEYHYPEMFVSRGTTAYARVSRWQTGEIPLPEGTERAFIFTCLPEDVSFIARVDITRVGGLVPGRYRARWFDSSLESHDGPFEITVKERRPRPAGEVLTAREYWDFPPDEERPSLDIRRGGFLELQRLP